MALQDQLIILERQRRLNEIFNRLYLIADWLANDELYSREEAAKDLVALMEEIRNNHV